jgi:hypothetical protein
VSTNRELVPGRLVTFFSKNRIRKLVLKVLLPDYWVYWNLECIVKLDLLLSSEKLLSESS